MKEIDITENCGYYASKWGISDFYPEAETSLRQALESGEDFDTGWFGCKKEITYAHIVKAGDEITVSVACHMDDLWDEQDLIHDALWEVAKNDNILPAWIIDSIRDAACDEGLDDHTQCSLTLPGSATFEEIVATLDKLEAEADDNNTTMYRELCGIVEGHIEYMKENNIEFLEDWEEEIEE